MQKSAEAVSSLPPPPGTPEPHVQILARPGGRSVQPCAARCSDDVHGCAPSMIAHCVLHAVQLLSLLVSMGGSLYLLHKIMQQMDPTAATRKQIRVAQDQIRRRLRRKVDLTNAEMVRLSWSAHVGSSVYTLCCI